MQTDVNLVKEAIYLRGLFITRYAAVEYAIAELVSRAFLLQAYSHLGHPPFGPTKKMKRLCQILELSGPIAAYKFDIQPRLTEIEQYAEYRNIFAHAIMVPKNIKEIMFRMYDHREGEYSIGELRFEMSHLETIANLIGHISIEFTALVARMCKEIPLAEI